MYQNIRPLADYIGRETCNKILCFHLLTESDFTSTFYYRTKITVFRKMLKTKDLWKLLESMLLSTEPNFKDIIEFVLRVVYNRPLRSTFTAHCKTNFIDRNYEPLDPSSYGWRLIDNNWEPV